MTAAPEMENQWNRLGGDQVFSVSGFCLLELLGIIPTALGPGANSEYTGHAMDGELYNPPDVKVSSHCSIFQIRCE